MQSQMRVASWRWAEPQKIFISVCERNMDLEKWDATLDRFFVNTNGKFAEFSWGKIAGWRGLGVDEWIKWEENLHKLSAVRGG